MWPSVNMFGFNFENYRGLDKWIVVKDIVLIRIEVTISLRKTIIVYCLEF